MRRRDPKNLRKQDAQAGHVLSVASEAAWATCAEVSRAMLFLSHEPGFGIVVGNNIAAFSALPAALGELRKPDHADTLLFLAVTNAVVRPLLTRIEVLGWLAHNAPGALAVLLDAVAAPDGSWPSVGRDPKAKAQTGCCRPPMARK